MTIELRPEVRWFAEQMEAKLRKNDHKGGWSECSLGYLHESLEKEWRELGKALIYRLWREVMREAADVANFAMMIADNARRELGEVLTDPTPPIEDYKNGEIPYTVEVESLALRLLEDVAELEAENERLQKTWRCFFCGYETRDRREAEAHFGEEGGHEALCVQWHAWSEAERVEATQQLLLTIKDEQDKAAELDNLRIGRIAELEAENERLRKQLKAVADRMAGQDNEITAHPIYVVQQRWRIYGMDPQYAADDEIVWCWHDDFREVSANEAVYYETEYEETGREPDGLIRVAYHDTWEWVQPFFSRRGAEVYIEANRHRLTDPRIYIESGYRNDEWQAVRAALIGDSND